MTGIVAAAPAPPGASGSASASPGRAARQRAARKRIGLPLAIFGLVAAVYLALVAAAIVLPPALGLLAGALAGLSIGQLFIVGHDACHNSYTSSRPLNKLVGRLAFLPSLQPFSLWDLGHNRTHHRFSNVRGKDYVWEPLTPREYASLGPWRRRLYRFYRSPPGIAVYYAVEIWGRRTGFARPSAVDEMRPLYLVDNLLVLSFLGLELAAAAWFGSRFGRGPLAGVAFGVLLPFLVWSVLVSIVTYLQHTHPAAPWYRNAEEWRQAAGALFGTVHVRTSWLARILLLNVTEHPAHHLLPGAPLYNLLDLQRELAPLGGATLDLSWSSVAAVIRQCKLFDLDTGCWVGFEAAERLSCRSAGSRGSA